VPSESTLSVFRGAEKRENRKQDTVDPRLTAEGGGSAEPKYCTGLKFWKGPDRMRSIGT